MTQPGVPASITVAVVGNNTWNLLNFRRALIEALVADGYRVLLLSSEGPEREKLSVFAAQFIPLKHLRRKSVNPFQDLRLIAELAGIYQREEVDIALHHTIKPVVYGSLAARWCGIKNVVTITGLGFSFLGGRARWLFISSLYRLSLQRAKTVLFQNPDDRELFVNQKIVSSSVTRLTPGSGINPERFPYVDYDQSVPGRFLFIGRLLSDKGIREFIGAARRARQLNPLLTFQVAGDIDEGNSASVSMSELSEWRTDGTIDYLGNLADVRSTIAKASFVVLPSYREGCPMALLEAASMGRPLIAFDVPGSREVAINGKTGWLVAPRDEKALGDAFLKAASTSFPERESLGQAGRKLVEGKFSDTFVAELYLNLLKSILQS